jgi:hypothetical protein
MDVVHVPGCGGLKNTLLLLLLHVCIHAACGAVGRQLEHIGIKVMKPAERERAQKRHRIWLQRTRQRDLDSVVDLREQHNIQVDVGAPCEHCGAMLFVNEPRGMCCDHGQHVFRQRELPPELQLFFFDSADVVSNRLLARTYNHRLNVASFGISDGGLTKLWGDSNLSLHGTVYHRVRSASDPYTSWLVYNPCEVDTGRLHVHVKGKDYVLSQQTLYDLRCMLLRTSELMRQYRAAFASVITCPCPVRLARAICCCVHVLPDSVTR